MLLLCRRCDLEAWGGCDRLFRERAGSGRGLCYAKSLEMNLGGSAGKKPFTYRWIPDRERSKGWGWGVAKSRFQPEDLELTPWDAVRPSRLHFDLRRVRFRSWPCFGFDDDFVVDGGTLVTSYCRGVDVDGDAITDT